MTPPSVRVYTSSWAPSWMPSYVPPVPPGGAGGTPGWTSLGLSPSSGQYVLCMILLNPTGPCLEFPTSGPPPWPRWVFPLRWSCRLRPLHLHDSSTSSYSYHSS